MSAAAPPTSSELIALPKVDLFRRLGGALASPSGPDGSWRPSMDALNRMMAENETRLASNGALPQVLRSVMDSVQADNIAHLELAVSPAALGVAVGSLEAAFDELAVARSSLQPGAAPSFGWLISVAAADPVDELARSVTLARERGDDGVLGLAVLLAAGDPTEADALLAEAQIGGVPMMVQLSPDVAPDWASERLTRIAPSRIAFGNQSLHSLDALAWIRRHRPVVLVCLNAERAVGVWPSDDKHPLTQMIQAGMQVNLASWAPGLLGGTLTDDYRLAAESLGLSLEALRGLTLAGVQASFLEHRQKRRLEREFENAIFGFPTEA